MATLDNITGKKFGRLTVVQRSSNNKWGQARWECHCECGGTVIVQGKHLRKGSIRSCGCLHTDRITKHGESTHCGASPELDAYHAAKARCNNPHRTEYSRYGGRGIEFRFQSFEEFLKEVGRRPTASHSIDRINNDGHYEPGNVRWATRSEQQRNKRSYKWKIHRA